MTIELLINKMKEAGLRYSVSQGRLVIEGIRKSTPEALIDEIKQSRDALVDYLSRTEKPSHDIVPVEQQYHYPVSHAQKRLLIIDQLSKDLIAYNIPLTYVFSGTLDAKALEEAINLVVKKHESLRTTFVFADGEQRQKVWDADDYRIPLKFVDLSFESDAHGKAHDLIRQESTYVFDLSKDLVKATLVKIDEQQHAFCINMHHIITDGWSSSIIQKEISETYASLAAGRSVNLQPLDIQYKDFSVWQHRLIEDKQFEGHQKYWLNKFDEEVQSLDLPVDRPYPPTRSFEGDNLNRKLSQRYTKKLKDLGIKQGASAFVTYKALVFAYLRQLTGQEDLTLGSLAAGRDQMEMENQVGLYVNNLVLRVQVELSKPFAQLIKSVRDEMLNAIDYQAYPYDKLVEELKIAREPNKNPLFDVMVSQGNMSLGRNLSPVDDTPSENDLGINSVDNSADVAKFDLNFGYEEHEHGAYLGINYNTDIFDRLTIEGMADDLLKLIEKILDNPELPLSTFDKPDKEQRDQLFKWGKGAEIERPEAGIYELFQEQCQEHSDRLAVTDGETSLSYQEFEKKADQFAAFYQEKGLKAGDYVLLILAPSTLQMAAIYGAWKTGIAYVPAEPGTPENRLSHILQDSGTKLILLDEAQPNNSGVPTFTLDEVVNTTLSDSPAPITGQPDLPAYMIYTSGTTGQPKGVKVNHRSLVNLAGWLKETVYDEHAGGNKALLTASFTFDASLQQIAGALISGGTLVLCQPEIKRDPVNFLAYIADQEVSVMDCTPGFLQELLFAIESGRTAPTSLKHTLIGGEALSQALANQYAGIFGGQAKLYNVYGPTETTVDATWEEVTESRHDRSVGKPLPNNRVYIVNKSGELALPGRIGEIVVAGAGVSQGYQNKEELTEKTFKDDPWFAGERMFFTGDYGRWLPNGSLAFYGRRDEQVKIRGYRIETSEIEKAMVQVLGCEQVRVITEKPEGKPAYLIAYYTTSSDLSETDLRTELLASIPAYMIPQFIIRVEHFKLTTSGKIDRRALPRPQANASTVARVAPKNEEEQAMAEIWQTVLELDFQPGVTDNYFELGGHSLNAMRIVSRVYNYWNTQVSIREVFEYPTILELIERIHSLKESREATIAPAEEDDEAFNEIII